LRSNKKGNRICGKRTARAERVNPEMKTIGPVCNFQINACHFFSLSA